MEPLNVTDLLRHMSQNLVASAIGAIPTLLTAVVLILVAVGVAKAVEWTLRKILVKIRIDTLAARAGVDTAVKKLGIVQPLGRVVPRVVYVLLLALFAQTAADALRLTAVSNAIGGFLAYLPNLLAAFLLVLVGSVFGQFAGQAVSRAARESGIDYSSALGNAVSTPILVIAAVMAIGQLKFNEEIIRIITACALSGLALAFGLSFGLGTRDITRNIVAGFYARKIFEPGSPVEIRGVRGTLRAITPIQTLVDSETQTIAVANSAFLDETIAG